MAISNPKFEINDVGDFRFFVDDESGRTRQTVWTPYKGIATLRIDERVFFAVSHYYDGVFPIETVLECKRV